MLRREPKVSKRITRDVRSSLRLAREAPATIGAFRGGIRLPPFQLRLAKLGRFSRICACFYRGFLEKETPALVPVRRALLGFEILQRCFGVGSSLNDLDYSAGLVSTHVVTDYDVRCLEFFVGQMFSLDGRKQPVRTPLL
jgi:hypothetical protein